MTARVVIDLNVRVGERMTFAGVEDVTGGPVAAGDDVEVVEVESGISGPGHVTRVTAAEVYLSVDWGLLRGPVADEPRRTPAERAPGYPESLSTSTSCGWRQVCDDAPCSKTPGHEDPHRVRSPYGDGRWRDHDVHTGAEVDRGGPW